MVGAAGASTATGTRVGASAARTTMRCAAENLGWQAMSVSVGSAVGASTSTRSGATTSVPVTA